MVWILGSPFVEKKNSGDLMIIVRGLIWGLFQFTWIALALLLTAGCLPDGTWRWQAALVFLVVYAAALALAIVIVGRVSPRSLEARLQKPISSTQPVADRVVTTLIGLAFIGWFIFIPFDVFYLKLLPKPYWVISGSGMVFFLLGFLLIVTAVSQNEFARPIVKDQSCRHQTLVDAGVYSLIRHPMYLGLLPFKIGIALWLESYAGMASASVLFFLLVARIRVEEKFLLSALPGYRQYRQRVRYRLLPYIW
jgi:protein-S-isoprenylcysteine O-methyltransferase Ste14